MGIDQSDGKPARDTPIKKITTRRLCGLKFQLVKMICFRVDKFKSKNMSHAEENHIRNNLHDLKMMLERIEGVMTSSPVLTREEAMLLSRQRSRSSFYDWCRHMHIATAGKGRYSRREVMQALSREAKEIESNI